MILTASQIQDLHFNKKASPGETYNDEKGASFVGMKDGSLFQTFGSPVFKPVDPTIKFGDVNSINNETSVIPTYSVTLPSSPTLEDILLEYDKQMEISAVFPVVPGSKNDLRIRQQILNEHQESSREILGTVNSTTSIGQIFKSSSDNINSIFFVGESAAAETIIDDIEEVDNATLQAAWVLTGTNLAVLDTTIKSPNNSSTKSMKLMMDAADTWTNTFGAVDLTGGTIEFDYYQTKETIKATMTISIGDGVNTSVLTIPVAKVDKKTWKHHSLNIDAFVGTANVTAITQVIFTVTLVNVGELAYVDNIRTRPKPGNIKIELWDMGSTIPANNGTVVYTSGKQYTTLGDLGISGNQTSSITISLKGGKQLYYVDEFIAGVAEEMSGNIKLNKGNYYALIFHYVDTNVSIYGADTTQQYDYYKNGYAFSIPLVTNTINPISGATGTGQYSDLAFGILSTDEVYVTKIELKLLDGSYVSQDSSLATEAIFLIEDENMSEIIIANEKFVTSEHKEDISIRPILMKKGYKAEVYYNSGISDLVRYAIIELKYLYKTPEING